MFQLIYTAVRTLAIGHALKKAGADPVQQAADIVDSAKEDPGGFLVDIGEGIRKLVIIAACLFFGFLCLVELIRLSRKITPVALINPARRRLSSAP